MANAQFRAEPETSDQIDLRNWGFKPGVEYPNQLGFEQAQEIAKASKAGLWSQPNQETY